MGSLANLAEKGAREGSQLRPRHPGPKPSPSTQGHKHLIPCLQFPSNNTHPFLGPNTTAHQPRSFLNLNVWLLSLQFPVLSPRAWPNTWVLFTPRFHPPPHPGLGELPGGRQAHLHKIAFLK